MVRVFLADLRHDWGGVMAVDVMPLGIGFMKAVLDREVPEARSRVFAYPERLLEAIQEDPPEVLMLSNYSWNEALSLHVARVAKRLRPETLVVLGGPNLHLEDDRKVAWFRERPELDLYALGEADFLAARIVRAFLEAGASRERLLEGEVPSALIRRPGGEIDLTPVPPRMRELDDIPSPWTTGVMDGFFDGRLAPMIETNRGCPFKCTFCAQGTDWYTKVSYFDVERLREDFEYIGRSIRERAPSMGTLVIADPNFGMFERDAEIAGFLGETQERYGWPTFISASTGKNRPDRIMKALERVNNALTFRQALQSTNPKTLEHIKRANIKQEAYAEVMTEVQGRGMRSISDLILGLPEETLASHVGSINDLVDAGTEEMYNFQLMLLKGTELETTETRSRYRFDTRHRVVSKAFGEYAGERVFDVEEITVATSTLSYEEYLQARKYAFAFSVFWNNSWFADGVRFAERCGAKRSEVLGAMLRELEADEGRGGGVLRDFVAETEGELFRDRASCVAFYEDEENFRRLAEGEIGDNLLYKYRAIASFFRWPEICAVAMRAIRSVVEARGARLDRDFWSDFETYVRLEHAHGGSSEEILAPDVAELRYDVAGWLDAGAPVDPSPFRLEEPKRFEFALTDAFAREVADALRVWGNDVKGLTKGVTRIRAIAQVRVCRPARPAATPAR